MQIQKYFQILQKRLIETEKVSNETGFRFTKKELEAALSEIPEEELKKVTGGSLKDIGKSL
jgi:hypothetical protein